MKKLFLAATMLLLSVTASIAQNRSINFEQTKVWKEIIEKAKAEKKLIFVDCYTDWCGPCKWLAANIFTQDSVADFFNAKFVNAKFEMEKDADGIMLKDKFQIKAFPTLVFADPTTGNVVHRLVGAGDARLLIAGGHDAMDPTKNLDGMMKRYESGYRSPEFVAKYLKSLKAVSMSDLQEKVAMDYLSILTVDQLATEDNWLIIRENLHDPLSKPMREVMANRQKFYDVAGQDAVDSYLVNSIVSATTKMALGLLLKDQFDKARNTELIEYLRNIDYPEAAQSIIFLETAELAHNANWNGVIEKVKEVEKSNIFKDEEYERYFSISISLLSASKDKTLIDESVKMINQKIDMANDNYFLKTNLSSLKRRLYSSIGEKEAADKAEREAEEYAKLVPEPGK